MLQPVLTSTDLIESYTLQESRSSHPKPLHSTHRSLGWADAEEGVLLPYAVGLVCEYLPPHRVESLRTYLNVGMEPASPAVAGMPYPVSEVDTQPKRKKVSCLGRYPVGCIQMGTVPARVLCGTESTFIVSIWGSLPSLPCFFS